MSLRAWRRSNPQRLLRRYAPRNDAKSALLRRFAAWSGAFLRSRRFPARGLGAGAAAAGRRRGSRFFRWSLARPADAARRCARPGLLGGDLPLGAMPVVLLPAVAGALRLP